MLRFATLCAAALLGAGIVSQAAAATLPSVEDERPAPNSVVGSQYPQIYARLAGGDSAVDPATVRVILDGQDITETSTISSAYVAYTPGSALDSGTHTVDVSGQTESGAVFAQQWSFQIQADFSAGDVATMIGGASPSFGFPRFGFFPPGFSVFAPGPQFFVFGQPIVIVFFSPFFPNGAGFFTVSGIPGQFVMTPWLGCPGFFWGAFSVPFGVFVPNGVVAAHFTLDDGRTVVAHSTAPLHIDGTRRSLPATMRFAVRARLVNHPMNPRALVAFTRVAPAAAIAPVRRSAFVWRTSDRQARITPVVRRAPVVTRPMPVIWPNRGIAPRMIPVFNRLPAAPNAPIVIPVVRAAPVLIPRKPPT